MLCPLVTGIILNCLSLVPVTLKEEQHPYSPAANKQQSQHPHPDFTTFKPGLSLSISTECLQTLARPLASEFHFLLLNAQKP